MQLPLQNFTTLVQNMAASVQSAATQLVDLTVGSTLRAILEANASLALWLQWLILQVLQSTRAATSTGADLDSWMGDFSLARLPAVPASGIVTLSRFTPLARALAPVGALVRTADGAQSFAIVADQNSPYFSSSDQAYILPAGVASVDVPVAAQVAGALGNVQAGSISLTVTAMPAIDSVSNALPLQNGLNAESDDAFRARFRAFIQSRSRATPLAVENAIGTVQQGLQYAIAENVDSAGNTRMGNFVVTVDDGSGTPPSSLLQSVTTAVEAVRPLGSTFTVRPPSVSTASVSLSIIVRPDTIKNKAIGAVSTAIQDYINRLSIGAPLAVTRLAQIAYAAHSSVVNVTDIRVNGDSLDLIVPASGVIKTSVVAVS